MDEDRPRRHRRPRRTGRWPQIGHVRPTRCAPRHHRTRRPARARRRRSPRSSTSTPTSALGIWTSWPRTAVGSAWSAHDSRRSRAQADRRRPSTGGLLPGIALEPQDVRNYPQSGGEPGTSLASHHPRLRARDGRGGDGVERYYDERLTVVDPGLVDVRQHRRRIASLDGIDPPPLRLTIDSKLQKQVEKELNAASIATTGPRASVPSSWTRTPARSWRPRRCPATTPMTSPRSPPRTCSWLRNPRLQRPVRTRLGDEDLHRHRRPRPRSGDAHDHHPDQRCARVLEAQGPQLRPRAARGRSRSRMSSPCRATWPPPRSPNDWPPTAPRRQRIASTTSGTRWAWSDGPEWTSPARPAAACVRPRHALVGTRRSRQPRLRPGRRRHSAAAGTWRLHARQRRLSWCSPTRRRRRGRRGAEGNVC